jgi:hypothetical protein
MFITPSNGAFCVKQSHSKCYVQFRLMPLPATPKCSRSLISRQAESDPWNGMDRARIFGERMPSRRLHWQKLFVPWRLNLNETRISSRRESWDMTFCAPSVFARLCLHVFGNTIPSTVDSSTRLTSAANTWLRHTFVVFDKRVYLCGTLGTLLKYAALQMSYPSGTTIGGSYSVMHAGFWKFVGLSQPLYEVVAISIWILCAECTMLTLLYLFFSCFNPGFNYKLMDLYNRSSYSFSFPGTSSMRCQLFSVSSNISINM